jgi:hypothetical protein
MLKSIFNGYWIGLIKNKENMDKKFQAYLILNFVIDLYVNNVEIISKNMRIQIYGSSLYHPHLQRMLKNFTKMYKVYLIQILEKQNYANNLNTTLNLMIV